ncbi:BspA family leucine-rich repeat surface protein [Epilithonimonas hominis]|uniref:BspA family leucine-rich repeat surface protein n=2 Tax=Epilithonimonas hominis TaxID=420404 RepID=UPI002899E311|nr:BspA family leucine-rich repeat surface protein [Epilithonimonas hominis]
MKKLFFLFSYVLSVLMAAKTPIITKWQTNDGNIKVRSIGSYTYTWEQEGNAAVKGSGTVGTGITNIITFPAAGKYILKITPDASFRFVFDHGSITYADRSELIELSQWGDSKWNTNMAGGFYSCGNLKITATDVPNFTGVTDMSNMFQSCSSITSIPNINQWDTSSVTNMSQMFSNAQNFNGDLSGWDTSAVTNMNQMFNYATKFNSDISKWNTGKVTDMGYMFTGANAFNQDISNWNVASVYTFYSMFNGAGSFNQNLGTWQLKSTIMYSMLDNSGMDCINYGRTLYGWASQSTGGGSLGAKNLIYGTEGKIYRDQLIAKGWTISGDFYDDSCTGSVLSANDVANKKAVKIYPNPVDATLFINSEAAEQAYLYNTAGQMLKTIKLNKGTNSTDVSTLAKGLYILKVGNDSFKIIKK